MKVAATTLLALSMGLACIGTARADRDPYFPDTMTPSTETRAQVLQELRMAQSRGQVIMDQDANYPERELQLTPTPMPTQPQPQQ